MLKWLLCFSFSFFLLILKNSAQNTVAPKYANEFLQLGVGARTFGLAQSCVSFIDDVSAGYWNPSGILNQSRPQAMLMHSSYFGGMAQYDYGAFQMGLDTVSHVALSFIRFAVDDIPDTRFLFNSNGQINYNNIRLFTAADYGLFFTYARKIEKLKNIKLGASIKIIHRVVGSFSSSWGFGFDVGIQQTWRKWKWGIVARDILGTYNTWSHNVSELQNVYAITQNKMPSQTIEITLPRVIVGVSRDFSLYKNLGLLATLDFDVTFDGKRNTVIKSHFLSAAPHGGIELDYNKIFFLRIGAGQIQETENFEGKKKWVVTPTAGLGFKIKMIGIDYALSDVFNQAEGLYSHIFSVKVDFNEKK